jgi:hypothetical protein
MPASHLALVLGAELHERLALLDPSRISTKATY